MEARHISYDFMGNMCGRLSIQVGTYVVNALTKMRESLMSPDNRILATNIVRRVSLGDRSFVNPIKYLLDPDIGLVQRSRARLVDRKSTRLNSSHTDSSRMPSSA